MKCLIRILACMSSPARIRILFIAVCIFSSHQFLLAQNVISDTTVKSVQEIQEIPQKDITDLFRSSKKKAALAKPDSTLKKPWRKKSFIPLIYPGYALVTGFQAAVHIGAGLGPLESIKAADVVNPARSR